MSDTSSSTSATASTPNMKSGISTRRVGKRLRKSVNVACEYCRKHRNCLKCTGHRPICEACKTRQIACKYDSVSREETNTAVLRRKLEDEEAKTNASEELFTALQTYSEEDAMAMYCRLHQGVDPGDVLGQQLSVTREASKQYYCPFPDHDRMPTRLETSDSPYLKSLLFRAAFDKEKSENLPKMYQKPYHVAELFEPLIDRVKPSEWTNVTNDDFLMRMLLRAYILHEYPSFPIFQKDILFQAMIELDRKYCSPLLVNALLAEACELADGDDTQHSFINIPNRSQYWVPQSLGYRFLAEANRLWELKSSNVDLVRAQAAALLSLNYWNNGMDKLGRRYLERALDVAEKLGLFGDHADEKDHRMLHARIFSAWGLFNWQCIHSYSYHEAPLIPDVPARTLPSPDQYQIWYGEFKVRYPDDSTLIPAQYGHCFKALSDLRSIIHNMAKACYSQKEGHAVAAHQILSEFSRLEEWYEKLPTALLAVNIAFPWQLNMHMELYLAVKQFSVKQANLPVSKTTGLMKETAEKTAAHAVTHLEILARLYYLKHSFQNHNSSLTTPLSFIAGAAMDNLRLAATNDADTIRPFISAIILSLRGLYDQGQHTHLASIIYRLMRNLLDHRDLAITKKYLTEMTWNQVAADKHMLEEGAQSLYPLTLGRPCDDLDSVRLEHLVQKHVWSGINSDMTVG
ncbi:hypothetical protein GGI35DRAFT_484919 [Trichoderma velutinum]